MKETILLTDGYKINHHKMYPVGIEMVYSNFTPRGNKFFPDAKLNINIVHAVNGVGLQRLSETFDHVYITNSYRDWKKSFEEQRILFPENITQIDVI